MHALWSIRPIVVLTACVIAASVAAEATPLYAFTSDRDGPLGIFVAEESGVVTNVTRKSVIGNGPGSGYGIPAWSPDGSQIAFSSYELVGERTEKELYLMDADGANMRRLTNSPGSDWYPSWCPDGTRIAFVSERDGDKEVYVMNADGSGQQNVTLSPGADSQPAWSPKGGQIAFRSDREGVSQILLMAPDGFDLRVIPGLPSSSHEPTWSPSGTQLAVRTRSDIRIMEVDGTEVARLDPGWSGYGDLAWSPDGRELAFEVLDSGKGMEIHVLSVETGAVHPLVTGNGQEFGLSWFPSARGATAVHSSSWAAIKSLLR